MSLEPAMSISDIQAEEPELSPMARRAIAQMNEFKALAERLETVPATALDDEDRLEMANLKILCGTAIVDLAIIAATPNELIVAANLRDEFKEILSLSSDQCQHIKSLLQDAQAGQLA